MVYLAIVAGLAVAGLVPALIAVGRGRAFWAWWPYGAVLFVVALPHALLLRPRDGVSGEGRRSRCPACGETLPAVAVSCRYCGHDLSGPFARSGNEGPGERGGFAGVTGIGAAASDGSGPSGRDRDSALPWSDEEFARVSRMGPGEPERESPSRAVLGIAAIAVTAVSAGALAVAFMPAGAWFGDERPSSAPEEAMRLPDGISRYVALPEVTEEPVFRDGVTRPPPSVPDIPVVAPSPLIDPRPGTLPPPLPPRKPASRLASRTPVEALTEAPGGIEAGDLVLLPDGGPGGESGPGPPDTGPAPVSPSAAEPETGATGARHASRGVPEEAPQEPPAPSAVSPDAVGTGSDIQAVGELVEWLQRRLASFGFYDGPIHGRADARTRQAIREWQQALEMTPSGNIDHALVVSLRRALPDRSALETR